MKSIIFRVDSSALIGFGHVSRCLSLAEAFQDLGHSISFICRDFPGSWQSEIERRGFGLSLLPDSNCSPQNWLGCSQEQDAADTLSLLRTEGMPSLVVVDHYAISSDWESTIRAHGPRVLVIDDLANRKHQADWLVDQNYYAKPAGRYGALVAKECVTLLGPEFALLKKEFAELHSKVSDKGGSVNELCVFMGGGDPRNCTGTVLEALADSEFKSLRKHVVVSVSHPKRIELEKKIAGLEGFVFHGLVEHMADFLRGMDLGVGAGGVSTWERCCMGVPTIVLTTADNQVEVTKELNAYGAIDSMGSADSVTAAGIGRKLAELIQSPEKRREMSRKGMALVDGRGAQRIALLVSASLR